MIETRRLRLRPWNEDDAEALFRYASDGRVSELAQWPRHESLEISRYVIKNIFMTNPYSFAIISKETDKAIGCIGLVPEGDEHYCLMSGEREVGYWIGFPYWNLGITTEALGALTVYCRENMHLNSLLITADSRNIASQRVAEKCGFQYIEDYLLGKIAGKAYRLKL